MLKKILVAGALLIFGAASGCAESKSSDVTSSEITTVTVTAATTVTSTTAIQATAQETTVQTTTAPPETRAAEFPLDFGEPDRISQENQAGFVHISTDGTYYYPAEKGDRDGPHTVYMHDDRSGNVQELDVPDYSYLYTVKDGVPYLYVPEKGICSFKDGETVPLNEKTVRNDVFVPSREVFCFTDEGVWFPEYAGRCPVFSFVSYDGTLSDKSYSPVKDCDELEYLTLYGDSLVFVYRSGDEDTLAVLEMETGELRSFSIEKNSSGFYISGGWLYYGLCRTDLVTGETEVLTEGYFSGFCMYGDRLIYADETDVYSLAEDGSSEKLLNVSELDSCNYITDVSTSDGKLFVVGGSGAFWTCIAEISLKGDINEIVYAGKSR